MARLTLQIDQDQASHRIDVVLSQAIPEISRTEVQQSIRDGRVVLSGFPVLRPSHRVREGDVITWDPPDKRLLNPTAIPLSVLFEDQDIVVLDKAAGLVVHPGAGTVEPTLVEGLLADRVLPVSDDAARPGVVHRLDRETSGVILFAKTPHALFSLQQQFAQRTTRKDYLAVADGVFDEQEGLIDAPIGRDPIRPQCMRVQQGGRRAETAFTVLSTFENQSLLWLRPHTGRTHQLRVHLRYIGHPVQGDAKYGGSSSARLMLHAWRLAVFHPLCGERMLFRAPVPPEFPAYPYAELEDNRSAP